MKKLIILLILLFCGCSNKVNLNCSYVDNSSILGIKKTKDTIVLKNNKIISFNRNINFSLQSGVSDISSIYKVIKLEGKALKKYIGGKYKISKDNNSVSMIFNIKKINDNLNYIGIDTSYDYDEIVSVYSELGFSCK